MFFPQKMLRVKVRIPEANLSEEIVSIGEACVLHIDTQRKGRSLPSQLGRVRTLLNLGEGYLQAMRIGIRSGCGRAVGTLLDEIEAADLFLGDAGTQIEALNNRRKKLQFEKSRLERAEVLRRELMPQLELRTLAQALKTLKLSVAVIPETELEPLVLLFSGKHIFTVHQVLEKASVAVAVLASPAQNESVQRLLESMEAETIETEWFLEERLRAHEAESREFEEALANAHKAYKAPLQNVHCRLAYIHTILQAQALLKSEMDEHILEGWVPQKRFAQLKEAVRFGTIQTAEADKDAPVLLKQPTFFKAFASLIENYATPRYGELDPTVPFALTFLIMFGIMFGDVGHGAVLAVLGGWVLKKRKAYSDLAKVFIFSGASAAFFGWLYGSFFGLHHVVAPLLFKPIDKIEHVMLFSVAVGVVFITASFLLNIISLLRQRDYALLFAGSGGILWLLIYWFMIGIAVKGVVLGLSVKVEAILLLVLFLTAFGFFIYKTKRLASSLLDALMNMVEHATNTVSFIRLGAFALAHAALFLAVFTIADIVEKSHENGLLYWLVVILGNCIIIVLEGVVVTIQTLRLEYYEFFKRFFKGGGTPYQPFCLKGEL